MARPRPSRSSGGPGPPLLCEKRHPGSAKVARPGPPAGLLLVTLAAPTGGVPLNEELRPPEVRHCPRDCADRSGIRDRRLAPRFLPFSRASFGENPRQPAHLLDRAELFDRGQATEVPELETLRALPVALPVLGVFGDPPALTRHRRGASGDGCRLSPRAGRRLPSSESGSGDPRTGTGRPRRQPRWSARRRRRNRTAR